MSQNYNNKMFKIVHAVALAFGKECFYSVDRFLRMRHRHKMVSAFNFNNSQVFVNGLHPLHFLNWDHTVATPDQKYRNLNSTEVIPEVKVLPEEYTATVMR